MSGRVSLSRRTALELAGIIREFERYGDWRARPQRAIDELKAALAPRRSKPSRLASRKTKKSERSKRNSETAAIREAVVLRAGGSCENCGAEFGHSFTGPGEMDHQFGRRVEQSVRNCWLLCRDCHRAKTENKPSSAYWLERMLRHARTHGYAGQATQLAAKLEAQQLVAQAESLAVTAKNPVFSIPPRGEQ